MEGDLEDLMEADHNEHVLPTDDKGNIIPDDTSETQENTEEYIGSGEYVTAMTAGLFDDRAIEIDDEPPPPHPRWVVDEHRRTISTTTS